MTIREGVRSVLGFALLWALPLLFPCFLLHQVLMVVEDRRLAGCFERLEEEVNRLRFKADARTLLTDYGRRLFDRVDQAGFAAPEIQKILQTSPFLSQAQVAVFQPGATYCASGLHPVKARFVVRNLWNDYVYGIREERKRRYYNQLLGPTFNLAEMVAYEDGALEVTCAGKPGLLYSRRFRGDGGVVVLLESLPGPFERLRYLLRRSDPGDGFRAVWSRDGGRFFSRGSRTPGWKRQMFRGAMTGSRSGVEKGLAWRVEPLGEEVFLLVSRPYPPNWLTKGFRAGVGLVLLFLGVQLYGWGGGRSLDRLPVLSRLVWLFALAVLIPGSLILRFGLLSYWEKFEILREGAYRKNLDLFREIDQRFSRFRQERLVFCQELADDLVALQGRRRRMEREAKKPVRDRDFSEVHLMAGDGKRVFTSHPAKSYTRIMDAFGLEMLSRYSGRDFPETREHMNRMIHQTIASPNLGMCYAADGPDRLTDFSMGSKAAGTMYWRLYPPNHRGRIEFVFFLMTRIRYLNTFLRTRVPPEVFIFNQDFGRWFPQTPPYAQTAALVAQALHTKQIVWGTGAGNGENALLTAYPSANMPGHIFLVGASLREAEIVMRTMRMRMGAIILGLVILAGFLSLFLHRIILHPVGHISLGVQEIGKGHFDYRVPFLGNDELGRIGGSFNRMVEEMLEVDMGRKVQASLIPEHPASAPGYETALSYLPLNELAGDYGDVIPRENGNLCLFVGDVSGHGIASALLTAMAKTCCFQGVRENRPLADLMTRLNGLIGGTAKRQRLMTFFGAELEVATGGLEWLCVGHNYPLLRRPDGSIQSLAMRNYPLGVRRTVTWKPEKTTLEPGASLLLYTDGLIEATNAEGAMFDYDRLEAFFRDWGHLPPAEFTPRLLATFRAFTGATELNDDVTILVLKRNA